MFSGGCLGLSLIKLAEISSGLSDTSRMKGILMSRVVLRTWELVFPVKRLLIQKPDSRKDQLK